MVTVINPKQHLPPPLEQFLGLFRKIQETVDKPKGFVWNKDSSSYAVKLIK